MVTSEYCEDCSTTVDDECSTCKEWAVTKKCLKGEYCDDCKALFQL